MRTAMYIATQTADVLLLRGADVNSKDTRANTTALNWAGGMNLADTGGRTPLMLTTLYGNGALVHRLLEAKADPSAKDGQGMTTRNWAKRGTRTWYCRYWAPPSHGIEHRAD